MNEYLPQESISEMSDASSLNDGEEESRSRNKTSQATEAAELVMTESKLFHTADQIAYADINIAGRREAVPVRGQVFRQHLTRLYFEAHGRALSSQGRCDATNLVEAHALFEGPLDAVHLRYARIDETVYIDLCNELGEVVCIDARGYSVQTQTPVRFRRPRGVAALPRPAAGGNVEMLRPFLNAANDDHFHAMLAWVVQSMNGCGPFFVLILQGEQGTAKSTTARVLRDCVDPSVAPLRRPPRDERDLMISAANNWVVALDNLSGITPALSDAICCLATGGTFGTRQLTTDAEEVLFTAKRPVIVNGIDELAERGDLNDRALKLNLPRLEPVQRRDEQGLWADFHAARPAILGAFYEAVSCALRNRGSVRLPSLPRMADAALWVTAAEPALGMSPGTFMRTHDKNKLDSVDATVGADAFGATLMRFAGTLVTPWEGPTEKLLEALAGRAPQGATYQPSWPKAPNALSNKLRRLAPAFRARGIEFTFDLREKGTGARALRIERVAPSHPHSDGQENVAARTEAPSEQFIDGPSDAPESGGEPSCPQRTLEGYARLRSTDSEVAQ